ncbi:hypothetical protein OROHE_002145 [Orobanche hederae]
MATPIIRSLCRISRLSAPNPLRRHAPTTAASLRRRMPSPPTYPHFTTFLCRASHASLHNSATSADETPSQPPPPPSVDVKPPEDIKKNVFLKVVEKLGLGDVLVSTKERIEPLERRMLQLQERIEALERRMLQLKARVKKYKLGKRSMKSSTTTSIAIPFCLFVAEGC